jgi:type 1 fimbriae regulatory protein FimB/type 1 fimbriae regulatory protein FimE
MTEATVRKLVARSGKDARIGLPVHPHMLRHATGFYLANNGVDTRDSSLSRPPQHHAHCALYAACAGSVSRAVA